MQKEVTFSPKVADTSDDVKELLAAFYPDATLISLTMPAGQFGAVAVIETGD